MNSLLEQVLKNRSKRTKPAVRKVAQELPVGEAWN